MNDQIKNMLLFKETRNALTLSLLATAALLVTGLEMANGRSALWIPMLVLMTIVFQSAVCAAPRGRHAHRVSKRYQGTISPGYKWLLLAVALAGCVLYLLGWYWGFRDGLKIMMALSGFFCFQGVAIALIYPLGRRLQSNTECADCT